MSFESWSLPLLIAAFGVAAGGAWLAGVLLARGADGIAERTGIQRAIVGALLLGGATSLPEIVTTVTAAWRDAPALAGQNLLGGIAMQTAFLAVADLAASKRPLSRFTASPALLFQGLALAALLGGTVALIALGEPVALAHVGLGAVAILAGYVGLTLLVKRSAAHIGWSPVPLPRLGAADHDGAPATGAWSTYGAFALGCALVVPAGWAVARSGEAIAASTGLSQTIVGVTLLALSTSLPELSTTISAARRGRLEMAVANVFGSNALCVALLFVADAAYRGGPLLNSLGRQGMFAAAIGLLATITYVWGLFERRDRAVLRMGYDSLLVLLVYAVGLGGLYMLG